MKNLFKIALSAFAALAIVNCTTDTTEGVGPDFTGKTVKLTVNASLDESRTVIGTPEDGKYPVTWSETGEVLSMAQVVNGSEESVLAAKAYKSTSYAVSNNGKNASFSFDVAETEGSQFDYIACYPYSALYGYYPKYADVSVTIPSEQTPSATSADAAASIMIATNLGNSTQPEEISLAFQHVVGYGKMTVKGLQSNGTVTNMTLTAPEVEQYLAGPYYYYYNEPETSNVGKAATSRNYISVNLEELAVDGSDDFDVWFAVAPSTLETFTVTFTADGKLYTKECEKPISFVAGEVSAFTLDMSEVGAEKDRTFELVTSVDQLKNEDYVLIVNVAAQKAMSSTQKSNNRDGVDVEIVDGTTITNPASTVAVFTLGVEGGNYTFFDPANNGYLYAAGGTSSNNWLRTQETLTDEGRWTVTIADDGAATVKCVESTTARNWMMYNSGSSLFACYASGQQSVYLFREVSEEGGTEPEPEQPAEPKVFRKTTTLEANAEVVIAMQYNGQTYLLRNDGTAGEYSDTTLPAVTVSELGAAGFTLEGTTLKGDVTNYTFRHDPQSMGSYFYSTTQEGVKLYRQSNTPILCTSFGTMWKVETSGDANVIYYYTNGFNNYLTVNADGEHAALSTTLSTVTFYVESDGTVEPDPEDPEEPAEDDVEYSKITTKNLPVGTTATPDSTPVIITVTKGGKTYVLYSTPDEAFATSNTNVTAKTLEDAKFTLTESGISGPVTNYTWTTTGGDGSYEFNSSTYDGIARLFLDATNGPLFIKSTPAPNVVQRATESGDYRLFRSSGDYLSVDDSGNLITTKDADDAVINFYGLPAAVTEQTEKEAQSSGPEFKVVTALESGKKYIITGVSVGANYALSNTGTTRVAIGASGPTAENYESLTYKATKSGNYWTFQSTANNNYLRSNSGTLEVGTSIITANWSYNGTSLNLANSTNYLNLAIYGWTLNSTATELTIYEVVE